MRISGFKKSMVSPKRLWKLCKYFRYMSNSEDFVIKTKQTVYSYSMISRTENKSLQRHR